MADGRTFLGCGSKYYAVWPRIATRIAAWLQTAVENDPWKGVVVSRAASCQRDMRYQHSHRPWWKWLYQPRLRSTLAAPEGQEKVFFSEEKNQKTFVPALISAGASPAGTRGDIIGGQKFFGSFFQKRTPSFLPI